MNRPRQDFVLMAPKPETAQQSQWPADRGWDGRIRMPECFVNRWAGYDTIDRGVDCE